MSDALPRYVLITPARNEEAFIERTIRSVVGQTILPARWVIVNDGSTDGTGGIARTHAAQHDWIEVVDMPERRDRSFAAKVHCFNAGYARVKGLDHEVVGNLDADISFEPDYLEFLLRRFAEDPRLGVAGTIFKEDGGYSSDVDSFEGREPRGWAVPALPACRASRRSGATSRTGRAASTGSPSPRPG